MSIKRTTLAEKYAQIVLKHKRKKERSGPEEARKEELRGPHTWRKTLKSSQ